MMSIFKYKLKINILSNLIRQLGHDIEGDFVGDCSVLCIEG